MEKKEHVDVLIIEDDEDDYFIARSLLSKTTGIECDLDWAHDYDEGLATLQSKHYDVCLVDYRLGSRDGLQLLREAGEHGVDTPMILLTGQGDYEVDVKAMMAGAADYLVKGQIDAQLLERSIRYARERKRADERIREQAALLDKARDAICAFDLERKVIYWNKSAERLTGFAFEEIVEKGDDRCLYETDSDKVDKAWESVLSRGEWSGDLRQVRKDGNELIVESRWTLVRDNGGHQKSVLVINTDVTERKRLESHFLRAQRMESIGTLVGGIAHDLGNLLVPILLGVKVLTSRFGDDQKTLRTLEMIRRSAQRGSDMVKQVLAFARGVEGERIHLKLEHIIREVEKIATETFPAAITVEVDIPNDLPMVTGDSTQLQQVTMNLCVNARDAMPAGGHLSIKTMSVDLSEAVTRTNPDAEP
ncbi:MAG: PAS domain S-box protein, partial [Rhodothermales bacterium]